MDERQAGAWAEAKSRSLKRTAVIVLLLVALVAGWLWWRWRRDAALERAREAAKQEEYAALCDGLSAVECQDVHDEWLARERREEREAVARHNRRVDEQDKPLQSQDEFDREMMFRWLIPAAAVLALLALGYRGYKKLKRLV